MIISQIRKQKRLVGYPYRKMCPQTGKDCNLIYLKEKNYRKWEKIKSELVNIRNKMKEYRNELNVKEKVFPEIEKLKPKET